jgi:hypothetical protein
MTDDQAYVLNRLDADDRRRLALDLFAKLKHGDDAHQEWLRTALLDYFEGRKVRRP